MDKDIEREPCEAFAPHPFRKQCKVCQKAWKDHPLTEDDADHMKKYLKAFSKEPEIKPHPQYAWTPPYCPEDRLDEYFKKFPEDKVPRHQSEGQKNRLKRLACQIPLSDVSLEKCRFLDVKYQEDFERYAQEVQNTVLRIGKVKEWTFGMPIQCPRCFLILEEGELVVTTSDNGGQAFHPVCFTCFQCRELLADLIHCCDIDGTVFCLRHYSEDAKRRCHACDELIFANRFAIAGDKFYHKEHLLCFVCDSFLEGNKGYAKNGELYCASCYEAHFCYECIKCQKKISAESRRVSFRDKNWHAECFTCMKCDTHISDIPFELANEKTFLCSECYQKDYGPKCEGCEGYFEPESKILKYEEKIYHVSCFKCVDCQCSIGTDPFVPHKGRAYCKSCHIRNFGVRCFRCKYAITDDRGLMYNKQPYHEACFTCCKCGTNISRRPFKAAEDDWYCFNCYADTFCQRCHMCEDVIVLGTDEVMYSYQDYRWHDYCFMCLLCCDSLEDKPFVMKEKMLVCKSCIEEDELKAEKDVEKEEEIPNAENKAEESDSVSS